MFMDRCTIAIVTLLTSAADAATEPVGADAVCTGILGGNILADNAADDQGVSYERKSCLVTAGITLENGTGRSYASHAIIVQASDAIFDCGGFTFVPADARAAERVGLTARSTRTEPSTNLRIRACAVDGFAFGIRAANGATTQTMRDEAIESGDFSAVWALSPSITFEAVKVSNSVHMGMSLFLYTRGTVVRDSTFVDNGGVGLYMSPHAGGHYVENNFFARNGNTKNRENLAVDAALDNTIRNNIFRGEPANVRPLSTRNDDGIRLYKNCGEHQLFPALDPKHQPHSIKRVTPADHNVIEGNVFEGVTRGVWIASRQSKVLTGIFCGDPSPYAPPLNLVYWRDFSKHNRVEGNRFENIPVAGVIVEDDHNTVSRNVFKDVEQPIIVGSRPRFTELDEPILDTTIRSNRVLGAYGNRPALLGAKSTGRMPRLIDSAIDARFGSREIHTDGSKCPTGTTETARNGQFVTCAAGP